MSLSDLIRGKGASTRNRGAGNLAFAAFANAKAANFANDPVGGLSDLIRGKHAFDKFVTATPATFATQDGGKARTVATVAVAKSLQEQTVLPAKVTPPDWPDGCRWEVHFRELAPVVVIYTAPRTREAVLGDHPGAIDASPWCPAHDLPSQPLTPAEARAVRDWLAAIGEPDIEDVIRRCQCDAGARDCLLRLAYEAKPDPFPDDRRTCDQCANLAGMRCLAAARGEIAVSRNYEPIRDLPRRCKSYAPGRTIRIGDVAWSAGRA